MKYLIILLLLLSCGRNIKVYPDIPKEMDDYYIMKIDTIDYVTDTYHYRRISYWLDMK